MWERASFALRICPQKTWLELPNEHTWYLPALKMFQVGDLKQYWKHLHKKVFPLLDQGTICMVLVHLLQATVWPDCTYRNMICKAVAENRRLCRIYSVHKNMVPVPLVASGLPSFLPEKMATNYPMGHCCRVMIAELVLWVLYERFVTENTRDKNIQKAIALCTKLN